MRKVVVTGGSRGLGLAIVRRLIGEGYCAIAVARGMHDQLAATVEHAAMQKHVAPPEWTREIEPLEEPVFGSALRSLREHLLFHAPIAFRRRNIFIDASVGARV